MLRNQDVNSLASFRGNMLWTRTLLQGLVIVDYTITSSASTFGKRSAVFTGISKHCLNQELNESSDANLIR